MQSNTNTNNELQPADRRTLTVESVGVAQSPPDTGHLLITVTSQKDTIAEAKNSVDRRTQYILQVIHNAQLKESHYKVFQSICNMGTSSFTNKTEIYLSSDEPLKLYDVSETLAKKLDASVILSDVTYTTSNKLMEFLSTQAASNAVQNARRKAVEMARLLDGLLGGPISINQTSSEQHTSAGAIPTMKDAESQFSRWQNGTVCMSSHVKIIFELKPKKRA